MSAEVEPKAQVCSLFFFLKPSLKRIPRSLIRAGTRVKLHFQVYFGLCSTRTQLLLSKMVCFMINIVLWKLFDPKKFWVQNNFWSNNFWIRKKLESNKNFKSKIFYVPQNFGTQKDLCPQFFLVKSQKLFVEKNLSQKNLVPKIFSFRVVFGVQESFQTHAKHLSDNPQASSRHHLNTLLQVCKYVSM